MSNIVRYVDSMDHNRVLVPVPNTKKGPYLQAQVYWKPTTKTGKRSGGGEYYGGKTLIPHRLLLGDNPTADEARIGFLPERSLQVEEKDLPEMDWGEGQSGEEEDD